MLVLVLLALVLKVVNGNALLKTLLLLLVVNVVSGAVYLALY